MIETDEAGVRTIEVFNALASILPMYDEESRRMFKASFNGLDIADLIPSFFQDLSRIAIKQPEQFTTYLNFMFESIRYIRGDRDTLPIDPESKDYFTLARDQAQKLMRQWRAVKIVK